MNETREIAKFVDGTDFEDLPPSLIDESRIFLLGREAKKNCYSSSASTSFPRLNEHWNCPSALTESGKWTSCR